jgi:hypothetical protein
MGGSRKKFVLRFTNGLLSLTVHRFFTAEPMPRNPRSGTVIDDVVTLPERYDFYVISQSVRQASSTPNIAAVVRSFLPFFCSKCYGMIAELHLFFIFLDQANVYNYSYNIFISVAGSSL